MAKHEFTSENQPDPEKKARGKAKKTLSFEIPLKGLISVLRPSIEITGVCCHKI